MKRYFMFILPFISFWKCLKSVLVLGVTQEVENNMLLPRFTQAYSHKRNFVDEEDRARVVSLLHFFSVMFTAKSCKSAPELRTKFPQFSKIFPRKQKRPALCLFVPCSLQAI